MDNELQIKEIISTFIHKDVTEISANTVIDRTAVRSSIHVHRLYAALAEAGLVVANPNAIRTFGDLQQAAGLKPDPTAAPTGPVIPDVSNSDAPFVGIDIEDVSNFVQATDYREDEFYKQSFSASEIAWCVLQPQPLASFAGKFAAKEAIVKADNSFTNVPFHLIEIQNAPTGKPQFKGFEISISHTPSTAAAVAIKARDVTTHEPPESLPVHGPDKWLWLFAIATFVLAMAALLTR